MVVFGHRSLSFENVDHNFRLVVFVRRKDLRFLCWNSRIALHDRGKHPPDGSNTHRQRCLVQENDIRVVLCNVTHNRRLYASSECHSFIGIDIL
mmetsp:Transcript_492/g.1044  ORF Transcript_492/g.1044 Transcript_492/m.1044 type:complete len:94 (-) Transcript_492:1403-1684(-)